MQAVRVHQPGGVEKLVVDQVPVPKITKGQVLIKVHFAGVNYIDTYHRSGVYPVQYPFIIGGDGSGIIAEVAEDVTSFSAGDRVAYYCSGGSYAEYLAVDAKSVVKVPEGVDLETGCACIVQGMTAHYLTHSTHKVNPGDNVLIHAAAGGTGQFLIQAAKILGGRVIGTVGSVEKKEFLEKEFPGIVDDIIVYGKGVNVAQEVRKLTQGKGVNVVYDGVGKDTFEQSLDSLAIRGHFVSFGNASGVVPPFSPLELTKRGSLSFTRPKMYDYVLDRKEFDWRANDLFSWIKAGKFKVNIHTVYPSLAHAGEAHTEIESRKTLGKILLRVASKL